jgi:Domain of unknown function (DUF4397)
MDIMKRFIPGFTYNNIKIALISIILLSVSAACTKNTATPPNIYLSNGTAFVAVANASPGTSLYTVYSDSTNIYPGNTIAYGSVTGISGGSPYEMIGSGIHALKLSADGNNFPVDSSFNFTANNYYTAFLYDTANSSGRLKALILSDNLNAPSGGNAEFRFLNLSPNSKGLNVSILNVDNTVKDSVSLNNIAYVGATTLSSDSLSSFRTIIPGTYKILIYSNTIESQNLFTANSISFTAGRIYTIYAKGYINGINKSDSLALGTITNF